jgi:multicomponent Na+:H+ antiporter subunit D
MISLLLIIPLSSAFLIPIIGKRIKWTGGAISSLAAFALAANSFVIISNLMKYKTLLYKFGAFPPPAGISLIVDGLSVFLLITVNVVAFLIALFSMDYMKQYTDRWKFYTLFMFMLAGVNGVLIAGDIFNLYVFLEVAAIAGYFLVGFGVRDEELEAAFKYAVMGSVASIFILLGIGLLYSYTSTLNMAEMARILPQNGTSSLVTFVSVLFLMGFGLKAALVPFHSWLPYAHSQAPAPISAMLSGVSIKVLGIYALARIFFNVLGMTPAVCFILIALAVLSMVAGSIMAFGQSDIKRLFAYSSISQIGYIALGLGIGTPLAISGALFHLFNHSIFKSLLFLNSGSIEYAAGTRDLNRIRNVIREDPVTGYTNLIGSLSICGVPPLGGFWSKLIIILACIQANHPILAFVAAVVSMLTLAYYFKALTPALFGTHATAGIKASGRKISFAMAAPMVILAILVVISGMMLLPNPGRELLKGAANVLQNGRNYGK